MNPLQPGGAWNVLYFVTLVTTPPLHGRSKHAVGQKGKTMVDKITFQRNVG
jgi:hypothetical protein